MDINELKTTALSAISSFLNSLDDKKASLLSYWLKDYIKFLCIEKNFSPIKLKSYRKGEIIKAHLGFNIGSEEGGLHYCVVLENNNHKSSPVITVAPLTSVKSGFSENNLRHSEVFIGNELYLALFAKINAQVDAFKQIYQDRNLFPAEKLETLKYKMERLEAQQKEFSRMKSGSIVLLGQITTISKIRIYDPKRSDDVLADIRLSSPTLDKIDAKIIELYTKKYKKE